MWRVRWPDGRLSDMTNLTRAKDAVACFMETEERRRRGRHRPSEGRLCVKTDSCERPSSGHGSARRSLIQPTRIIVQRGRVMSVKASINKLNDAMDAMRRPDSRMIQTNYQGRPDFWITPNGGRVEPDIAKKIIAHPQVIGGRDALFPGLHQTWRMRPGDAPDQPDEPSAPPGAVVRASAKSWPDAHSGTGRRRR